MAAGSSSTPVLMESGKRCWVIATFSGRARTAERQTRVGRGGGGGPTLKGAKKETGESDKESEVTVCISETGGSTAVVAVVGSNHFSLYRRRTTLSGTTKKRQILNTWRGNEARSRHTQPTNRGWAASREETTVDESKNKILLVDCSPHPAWHAAPPRLRTAPSRAPRTPAPSTS